MTRPHPAPRAARTTYAVWETTLRCNLNCLHCGSRAGRARPDELLTSEALDVIDELVEVGIDEVTFAGGEPFLRPDWPIRPPGRLREIRRARGSGSPSLPPAT